ncbi:MULTISPECIES: hypothetical protein [unclassified Streptomyces]|uniref:hypothetical protein n=1 Tax=unclassified Streptomyces TaxID=2593676 RepID=UPI0033C553AD
MPLVGALTIWGIQEGWGWIWGQISGPAEVKAYTPGIATDACIPLYSEQSVAVLKGDTATALQRSVPISDTSGMPAEFPITLQAKTEQSIVITGVQVKVLSSKAIPRRGLILEPDGCGALVWPRTFTVNLIGAPITTKPVKPDTGKAPVDFPFKVSTKDPEQVTLQLAPGDRDIRFTVKVEWVTDGEPGSKLLDNGGKGYRVMGRGNLPTYSQAKLTQVRQ